MKYLLMTSLLTLGTYAIPAVAADTTAVSEDKTTINKTVSSKHVKKAQKTLKSKGHYSGQETGQLDDETRTAIGKYQTEQHISGEGRFTRETAEQMGVVKKDKNTGEYFEDAGTEIKGHYSGAGKSVKEGSKEMVRDMKDGEVAAGAVEFGKGVGKGAKEVGKGTADAAKSVGKGVVDAFDGKNTEKEKTRARESETK